MYIKVKKMSRMLSKKKEKKMSRMQLAPTRDCRLGWVGLGWAGYKSTENMG